MSTWNQTFDSTIPAIADSSSYQGKVYPTGVNDIGSTATKSVTGGVGTDVVTLQAGDKYAIDIYADMRSFAPEETPLLTLTTNLKSIKANNPYGDPWMEEYEGDGWTDIALDDFRIRDTLADVTSENSGSGRKVGGQSGTNQSYIQVAPVYINNALYVGGQLFMYPLTLTNGEYAVSDAVLRTNDSTAQYQGVSTAANQYGFTRNLAPLSLTNKIGFVLKARTDMVGSCNPMIMKLKNESTYFGYSTSGTTLKSFTYSESNNPRGKLYFCFDDLPIMCTASGDYDLGSVEMKHQVIAHLYQWGYDTNGDVYMILDLSDSNIDLPESAGVTLDTASTGQWGLASGVVAYGSGTYGINMMAVLGTNPSYGTSGSTVITTTLGTDPLIGRAIRQLLIRPANIPQAGVPEFDRLGSSGNLVTIRERKQTMTQIFTHPKYGISGSAEASVFRFGNDFQKTRARNLKAYKQAKEATYLTGIKYVTRATNSGDPLVQDQEVRHTAGLLDYAMYPIRYMNFKLPEVSASETYAGQKLMNWITDMCESLNSFKQAGSKSNTFLVSKTVLKRLQILNALYTGAGVNTATVLGGHVTVQKPSSMSFGMPIYQYESEFGTVNFVHEPALDFATSFTIPKWMFGGSLNPRYMALAIDTQNIGELVFRSDKILGNIQEPDRDGHLEGIRGETGFVLKFPKNHAIIKLD